MPILPQLLMGGSSVTGATPTGTSIAEAVDFDGTNDYLSRSSDFVGNVDSKTFTFSCWVYALDASKGPCIVQIRDTLLGNTFFIYINSSLGLGVQAWDQYGTIIIDGQTQNLKYLTLNTWQHILVSFDTENVNNRGFAINDINTVTDVFNVYTNANVNFTVDICRTGNLVDNSPYNGLKGRLSHLFLDYTYRDLSIESNRRLFITEDLKPAEGLAALNPILYLPMTDHSTCHINEGTGGDFVQNGVIGQSERGLNQFNATASVIDGSNYLTYSDSATNGTLSYWAQNDGITSHHYSTGLVSISNITTALGDIVGEVFLSQNVIPENKFIDDNGNPLDLGIDGSTPDGTVPSTYLRLRANTPETNDGSGADATIVGGSLVGARGASEFWARSAKFDGGTGYLNQAISGLSDTKTLSYVIAFKRTDTGSAYFRSLFSTGSSANQGITNKIDTGGTFTLTLTDTSGTTICYILVQDLFLFHTWNLAFVYVDTADVTKSGVVINGVRYAFTTMTNSFIGLSSVNFLSINSFYDSGFADGSSGSTAFMYLTTDYIDFSDENNRLKFVDGLGYPVDIQPAIDNGDIPKPLFYLPFDDPDDLGKDTSGNDNHFTVNGTVTQGADVNV